MYRKGKLLFEKGEFDAAQRILNKACNLDPGSVVSAYTTMHMHICKEYDS